MISKLIEIIKKKSIQIYFGLLFVLLLFVYFPSFYHPPRSDHWPALYFFYRIHMLVGPHKWKYILTYDPLIKITFRPLFLWVVYFEHIIFGSNFVYVQIITFGVYFLSILLLYKLAINFCKSRILIAIFIIIFAFLFSHFDLVCWSFQSHIMLSFCLFLSGFISYINYIKLNRKILLFIVFILFLLAMLTYEAFLLWPLAIIILSYINWDTKKECTKKRIKLPLDYLSVIVPVYAFYGLFFFLNREAIRVYHESQILLSPLFSIGSFISSLFLVFFNVLYNNFLLNLVPRIAYPLQTEDNNLNMGGLIGSGYFDIDKAVFIGGGLVLFIFLFIIFHLYRKKQFEILKGLTFFMFLLFSELFLLFFFKSLVNDNVYNLTQFRFQYIPNAFFILIVIFLTDRFLKPNRRNKIVICLILFFIFISNIQATKKGLSILNAQLAPLEKLLTNIKTGIKTGEINRENRLYLDDNIAKKLPPLCWNKVMGRRCMRGTYQWLFSREEIKCFSSLEDAKWVIDENSFSIVSK